MSDRSDLDNAKLDSSKETAAAQREVAHCAANAGLTAAPWRIYIEIGATTSKAAIGNRDCVLDLVTRP